MEVPGFSIAFIILRLKEVPGFGGSRIFKFHSIELSEYKLTKKLTNTFNLIDEMNNLDLEGLEPLNNPLELNNVSREDEEKIEIKRTNS